MDNIYLHITMDYPASQKPEAVCALLRKNQVSVILEEENDSILGPFTREEYEKRGAEPSPVLVFN